MYLQLSDRIICVDAKEGNICISKSTGKELYEYSFDLDIVGKDDLDKFKQIVIHTNKRTCMNWTGKRTLSENFE